MGLITDPDNLSQGNSNAVADLAFTASSGITTTLTGAATLPAVVAGEFFEIRDSSTPGNNGLYVASGTPTTSSVTCDKVVGPNPVNLAAEATIWLGNTGAGTEKSVHFDTPTLTWYLLEQGNLSVDGVTGLAFHSFCKEEWKSDDFLISAAGFPMTVISEKAGQYIFGQDPSGNNNGWKPAEDDASPVIKTRRLVRNAGWEEIDSAGVTQRKYFNVTTLPTTGAFEDPADQAWYQFGTDNTDLAAAVDFEFAGEVNEPVKFFEDFGNPPTCDFATSSTITRSGGSFITDGYQVGGQVSNRLSDNPGSNDGQFVLTAVAALTLTVTGTPFVTGVDTNVQLAVDNDNSFKSFLRIRDADPNGKLFGFADLAAGGETGIDPKIIKLGLANSPDLDISATDATISGSSPWTEIRLRYLPADFNLPIDSAALRAFGIVIDVGTYSRSNGVSNGTILVTSADHVLGLGEALADYTGGTLILHDATAPDRATHTISGTPVDNAGTLEITLSSALTNSESNLSFSIQRSTAVVATRNQIWEKMQYQMRQALDIDGTDGVVNGKTADVLGVFEGLNLRLGKVAPTNPQGGGSGVVIIGFDANDTNNLFFFDNTATSRNFPFVAAGTLDFNQRSVDDTDGEFWLYFQFTTRTNLTDAAVVGPSGDTYDLESPGSNLPTLVVNDHIFIPAGGFADEASNGLFIVTVVNTVNQDYTIRKLNGANVGAAESGVTIDVDEKPYPSPDAIVVDDNGGADIVGNIGTVSVSFDFDYDNNIQGGRSAGTDAAVILVAGGLENIQMARTDDGVNTISRAVGLSFPLGPALERNYSNP